jgi:hypothetical protein
MFTRELDKSEWAAFFNAFSRHYQGHPMTLDLPEPHTLGTIEVIARDLPLVGIAAERGPGSDNVTSIEILLGTTPENHLMHTINLPTHVYVGQITNGSDEVIVFESERDPTVRLDFREPAAGREVRATFGEESGNA